MSDHYDRYNGMEELLDTNLAEVSTDMISRQAAIDDIWTVSPLARLDRKWVDRWLRQLPSAQPKMGKWIYHIDDLFTAESTMECNQCHAEQPLTCDDEFCPHCGAKMEVTDDTQRIDGRSRNAQRQHQSHDGYR